MNSGSRMSRMVAVAAAGGYTDGEARRLGYAPYCQRVEAMLSGQV